ncbi:hypothetical protein VNO78_01143 [Psophocarpus tetragonolobus]|uniref:Uncharacterized protein n=1 Tax=Psophocarpus tetragonolobus TaxID=3891 RepID=A0AAN9SYT7_PSOTE
MSMVPMGVDMGLLRLVKWDMLEGLFRVFHELLSQYFSEWAKWMGRVDVMGSSLCLGCERKVDDMNPIEAITCNMHVEPSHALLHDACASFHKGHPYELCMQNGY